MTRPLSLRRRNCPNGRYRSSWYCNCSYYEDANLLIAADCTAYAYGNLHDDFIRKHITLIGCPKLDNVDYTEKLTQIIANNNIKSVTIVRMEVPCCGGIEPCRKERPAGEREIYPMECYDDFNRRKNLRLTDWSQ